MAPLTKPKPVEPKLDGVVVKAGEGRVLPSVDRLHSSIEDKDGLEEREQCSEDDESNHRAALDPRDHQDAQPHAAETQDVDLNEGGEESRSALSSGGRKTRIAAGSDQWSSSGSRQTPPPRTSSRYQTSPYKTNPRNNPRVLPKGTPKDDNENISSDPLNTGGLFQLQPGESPKKNVSSTVTNGVEPRREEKPYLEEIERLRKRLSMKSAEITQYIAEIQIKNDIMEKQNNKIRDLKREIQDQEVTHSEDTHRKEQQTKRIRQQASTIREQDQRIQDLEIQVQQLQDENAEKSKTNKDLNDAWRRATNELARLSQQNQVYKVDDTTLMGMYEGIIYSAGNWAANYCAGRGRKTFSQDELSPLKPLTMYYAQYAASEKLRPVLMQSLIVKKLAMTVLNYSDIEPVGCLWAGRLSPGLRQIQKGLEPGTYTTTKIIRRVPS